MSQYIARITEITVHRKGGSIIDERATRIRLVDEGGGEFLHLEQEDQHLAIDPTELPVILEQAHRLLRGVADA